MPSIDTRFVPLYYIQQVIFDKLDGTLLANGSITFYKDVNRTIKKPVYQLSLSPSNEVTYVEMANPLTLSSIGGIVDENNNQVIIYAFPYDGTPEDSSGTVELYYATVYSEDSVFQFEINAFPNVGDTTGDSSLTGVENQLVNPQFAQVLFEEDPTTGTHVYTLTGTNTVTPVAPGWDMVSTGSGTVTVKQFPVVETTADGNPPYALDILSTGSLTSLALRQRLTSSPRLLVADYVCGTFLVNSQDSTAHNLKLIYTPSSGTSFNIVNFTTSAISLFETAVGTIQIGGTINTDTAPDGYVDIILQLPISGHVQISNIQVAAVSSINGTSPFQQESVALQQNHLFYYYQPQINYKPLKNIMTAWDFKLNPNQFSGSSVTVTTTPAYAWDQTIMCRAGGADVTVTRNSVTGGLQAVTTTAATAFYALQYLTGSQAKQTLGTILSANILAFTTADLATQPTVRVYLYRGGSTASIPTLPTSIGTLSTTGVFTLTAANWTEITRPNIGAAIGTVPSLSSSNATLNEDLDLGFQGWEITDATQIGDTDKFAMVVTYSCPIANNTVIIDSQCLVQGNIPTRPATQTLDEVIADCQYYYEKSYSQGVAVGTSTQNNAILAQMLTNPLPDGVATMDATINLLSRSFGVMLKQMKINTAFNLTVYSTDGTSGNVLGFVSNNGANAGTGNIPISSWNIQKGDRTIHFIANSISTLLVVDVSPSTSTYPESFILFHYTADSRLGIV